jgi:hypothetical protein
MKNEGRGLEEGRKENEGDRTQGGTKEEESWKEVGWNEQEDSRGLVRRKEKRREIIPNKIATFLPEQSPNFFPCQRKKTMIRSET